LEVKPCQSEGWEKWYTSSPRQYQYISLREKSETGRRQPPVVETFPSYEPYSEISGDPAKYDLRSTVYVKVLSGFRYAGTGGSDLSQPLKGVWRLRFQSLQKPCCSIGSESLFPFGRGGVDQSITRR
jgi:hypothetical protein